MALVGRYLLGIKDVQQISAIESDGGNNTGVGSNEVEEGSGPVVESSTESGGD